MNGTSLVEACYSFPLQLGAPLSPLQSYGELVKKEVEGEDEAGRTVPMYTKILLCTLTYGPASEHFAAFTNFLMISAPIIIGSYWDYAASFTIPT